MLIARKSIPRRAFLRGIGTAVSLPFLDAMVPAFASAAQSKPPLRMAFVYVPNGIDMRHWNPAYEGKLGELPKILKPLEPFREDITLLGNLTHNTGRALLDGAGDHGRCCGSYLTGIQVKKSTVDIKAGVSMDQIVASQVGSATRFPSLELGLEDARQSGDCDSGYSCAYTNNLAWRSETQPLPPILDPRAPPFRGLGWGGGPRGAAAPAGRGGGGGAPCPGAGRAWRRRRSDTASLITSWATRISSRTTWAPLTAGSSTSIYRPFVKSNARWRRPPGTTPRLTLKWTNLTACRPISRMDD